MIVGILIAYVIIFMVVFRIFGGRTWRDGPRAEVFGSLIGFYSPPGSFWPSFGIGFLFGIFWPITACIAIIQFFARPRPPSARVARSHRFIERILFGRKP